MLGFRPLSGIDRLAEVIDFCWQQTNQNGYCGYPVVMRDQADQADGLTRVFYDAADQLLVLEDERLIAVAALLVDDQARYLQTLGGIFTADFAASLAKLKAYRDEFYPGYMLLIGYPVIDEIRPILQASGSLIEELHFYEYTGHRGELGQGVKKLSRDEFSDLSALRDRANPEMYWSARRILEHWADWSVYRSIEGEAYLLVRRTPKLSEIYGLYLTENDSTEQLRQLILGAAEDVMIQSQRLIASSDPAEGLEAIFLSAGFSYQADYMAYSV